MYKLIRGCGWHFRKEFELPPFFYLFPLVGWIVEMDLNGTQLQRQWVGGTVARTMC